MATIILLNADELTKSTIIGGNIDADKFVPAIKSAQQLKIKKVLGQELYTKICDDFYNTNLSGLYLEMYEDYIKPMVSHKAAEIYLTTGAYIISNNGITKGKTEFSDSITKEEVDYLVEGSRSLYESYELDFLEWIEKNKNNIPEYNNTNYINNNLVGGWVLSKKRNCNNG